jgi:hypothetical protein
MTEYRPKPGHKVKAKRGNDEVFTLDRHYGGYGSDEEWHATHYGGEYAGTVLISMIEYIPRHVVDWNNPVNGDIAWGNPDLAQYDEYWKDYKPRHITLPDN